MAVDVVRSLGPGTSGSLTYESVCNAEDVSKVLAALNPAETKFLDLFGTDTDAISTSFEWFSERLRPAQDNAHYEKEDYTFKKIRSQEGLKNYIQHFQNSGWISDTQQKVEKIYGPGSKEFDKAVNDALTGMSKDIEHMLVSSTVSCAETPGSVPARSGGVPYFMNLYSEACTVDTTTGVVTLTNVGANHPIDLEDADFVYFNATTMPTGMTANRIYYIKLETSNNTYHSKFKIYKEREEAVAGASNTNVIPTTAGTSLNMVRSNVIKLDGSTDLTLEHINDVLQMIYMRGGNGNQAYMGPRMKRKFTALVNAGTTVTRPVSEMTQRTDAATTYESDFGLINAHVHPMYTNNRVDILDTQYWDLKWFDRPHEVEGLAKKGTYKEFVVEAALGLKATQPLASGSVINIKNT